MWCSGWYCDWCRDLYNKCNYDRCNDSTYSVRGVINTALISVLLGAIRGY